ncbi:MAG TPA: hypothetical protein VE714_12645 [Gemmatimonadales bacterium]|nr:hypothetical protein [Gemmatimonadales bacterium]
MPRPGDHGQRRTYQAGCRCTPCRASEATYRRTLRRQHAQGRPPLGATIRAVDAWRRIRSLKAERFTQAEIARRLGLKTPVLQLSGDVITLRNHLKIRRLARQLLSVAPDLSTTETQNT